APWFLPPPKPDRQLQTAQRAPGMRREPQVTDGGARAAQQAPGVRREALDTASGARAAPRATPSEHLARAGPSRAGPRRARAGGGRGGAGRGAGALGEGSRRLSPDVRRALVQGLGGRRGAKPLWETLPAA